MVTSFDTGHIGLFNMETQQLVLTLESAGPPGTTTNSASIYTPRTKSVLLTTETCHMFKLRT